MDANMVYCQGCGKQMHNTAVSCPACGAMTSVNRRSRVIAAVLALCFGGLGVHKFYLGKIGKGVLYLLFFWTFIPSIIAFFEGVSYLCMSDQKFAAKYPSSE